MKTIYAIIFIALIAAGIGNHYFSKNVKEEVISVNFQAADKSIALPIEYSERVTIRGDEFRATPRQKLIVQYSKYFSIFVGFSIFGLIRAFTRELNTDLSSHRDAV